MIGAEGFLIAINVFVLQSLHYSKKAYSVVKVARVLETILILIYLIVGPDRVEKVKYTNCFSTSALLAARVALLTQ